MAEYAAPVWHSGITARDNLALERVQKRACRIIIGKDYTHYDEALELCNLKTLQDRRDQLCLGFFSSLIESERFHSWVPPKKRHIHGRELRNADKLALPNTRTVRYELSPLLYMAKLHNASI